MSAPLYGAQFHLVDIDNKPMVNMVVYLQAKQSDGSKPVQLKSTPNQISPPVEIHQKNKQFTPYITVIQKGYKLQFINDDDITHHIYSAAGAKRFSFKLRKDNSTKDMLFDQVGHISMGCNIHDWMSGHVLVVDTPFFGITDEMGRVSFDDIPDANYDLVIWHPQLLTQDNRLIHKVSLPITETLTITVSGLMDEIPAQQSLDDFEFLEGY
ncbi:hypothetical protein [Shewanella sp. UCD-KL12]|uniref:hypothetical protein n=1 Tax=Shewanella sp. UCD-KL12 TaxID=1917163 RepID=UPI002115E544|nr:hypothetical protein [Shewanella sp. UCD-KL12]